jgi:hypothetical protein
MRKADRVLAIVPKNKPASDRTPGGTTRCVNDTNEPRGSPGPEPRPNPLVLETMAVGSGNSNLFPILGFDESPLLLDGTDRLYS